MTSPSRPAPALVRGVSLAGAVALVVGNMVGTSIYTLPAALAGTAGPIALVSWLLAAVGYLFVALVYASLGSRYPQTGGPYVYAREAFGDFAAFQTVWSYWISTVIGNAAIVTSVVGYAAVFWPPLAEDVWLRFGLAQALLWVLCGINILGVKQGVRVQMAIVLLNIVPLVVFSIAALTSFDPANMTPFAPQGIGAISAGAALVVWAYAGVESATVPAEEVRSPERTIRRGTLIGYATGTLVFLLSAASVIGAVPTKVLAGSQQPIALVAERTVGAWAAPLVAIAAILAGSGTLNGWILMAGRIPLTASRDGLFFRALGAVHPRFGTPWVALIVGTAVASAMLFLYFSRSLLGVYEFIVRISVLTTLLPHLYATAAELLLARRDRVRYSDRDRARAMIVAPIAFVFILWVIYGVGPEPALWGMLAVLAGTPLYVVFITSRRSEGRSRES